MSVAKPKLVIPIPDTRFESTFRRKLDKELNKNNVNSNSIIKDERVRKLLCLGKVICRDVIFMPFVQGMFMCGAFILIKPWLLKLLRNGKNIGRNFVELFGGQRRVRD
ncbi:hypothetical protein TBLA_0J01510 [Henningerozyma blattae CBS 6284]|uniref:Uncharacterized protein n=1 Tax=Henningerozyma blattae (strain ATCC 34711 / CBS 6284 / DSM 70876 / NBRC 10599 / NRRL Y-10934 / UCD 77-7) TaxID=1071380 RepID=I2H9U5_HENB6|nr:hypothetical protein TBLA_0J01510 [Tetrapisispora blattae CBS 6284]CCH63147.1 hypothetical protein TBLA_0J01510 [Tetrapisispora blattae CBS 6284]